jgi:hypothetical protein
VSAWARGAWCGSAPWAGSVRVDLSDLVGAWASPSSSGDVEGSAEVDVAVEATALDPGVDVGGVTGRLAAWAASDRPPSRVVAVVGSGWRGAATDPAAAARAGAVVAAARWAAVELAARRATVNVVAVPEGFPDAGPAGPAGIEVGVADLVHAVRFLLRPGNDYLTGQVLSLTGGDVLWSNQSM